MAKYIREYNIARNYSILEKGFTAGSFNMLLKFAKYIRHKELGGREAKIKSKLLFKLPPSDDDKYDRRNFKLSELKIPLQNETEEHYKKRARCQVTQERLNFLFERAGLIKEGNKLTKEGKKWEELLHAKIKM